MQDPTMTILSEFGFGTLPGLPPEKIYTHDEAMAARDKDAADWQLKTYDLALPLPTNFRDWDEVANESETLFAYLNAFRGAEARLVESIGKPIKERRCYVYRREIRGAQTLCLMMQLGFERDVVAEAA